MPPSVVVQGIAKACNTLPNFGAIETSIVRNTFRICIYDFLNINIIFSVIHRRSLNSTMKHMVKIKPQKSWIKHAWCGWLENKDSAYKLLRHQKDNLDELEQQTYNTLNSKRVNHSKDEATQVHP